MAYPSPARTRYPEAMLDEFEENFRSLQSASGSQDAFDDAWGLTERNWVFDDAGEKPTYRPRAGFDGDAAPRNDVAGSDDGRAYRVAQLASGVATDAAPARPANIHNNPGNIKHSSIEWAGDTGERYGKNNNFIVFSDKVLGLRAMARDLRTKLADPTRRTVDAILQKYSVTDPGLQRAIKNVTGFMGGDKDTPLAADEATLRRLVTSILRQENQPDAENYYLSDPGAIDEAIRLSRVSVPGDLRTSNDVREYVREIERGKAMSPRRFGR